MINNVSRVGIMVDTETLGLNKDAVVTQLAFVAWDLEDPSVLIREVEEYLPLEPQLSELRRTITGSTILWWLKQSDAARARFEHNDGGDYDELEALVNGTMRKLSQVIEGASEVQVWAKGPQFDIVIVETLVESLGLTVPWKYNQVFDLRTVMNQAGLKTSDVVMQPGLVAHHALSDCKYQLAQLSEAELRCPRRI